MSMSKQERIESLKRRIAQCEEKIQKETKTKQDLTAELTSLENEMIALSAKKICDDTQKQIEVLNLIANSGLTLEELNELLGKSEKPEEKAESAEPIATNTTAYTETIITTTTLKGE